ncbi:hypothetical protein CGH87_23660 [Vibrio parahaemolyticus]|uniref:hypothetical protein n=1 Tax=Vibrio parahaemolyticus TaxID=670 RepID=UPI0011201AF0|nr:hypothetical protein [Vibrio parahaemolyticus]TOL90363.1 hypothetical protein CGH87_23660 [Vibrio parahaemolyticus]
MTLVSEVVERSFTSDFHCLIALIQHLGAHEKWNSRTPRNIADSIGLDRGDVENVLDGYPAFFRKSSNLSAQKEPLYSLHIRYARRTKKQIEGEGSHKEWSAPLSSEEMQTLLNLVTNMIGLEAENRRLKEDSRHNNMKVWVALTGAFATAIAAILAQIVSSGS